MGTLTRVEVDGLEVEMDRSVFEDIDFAECMAVSGDEGADGAERLAASVKLMKMALGDEYGRVKRELRERNGGTLTSSQMTSFVVSAIEAAGAKN